MSQFYILTLAFGVALGIALGLMLNPVVSGGDQAHVAIWLEVVHRVATGIGGVGTFIALVIVLRQFFLLRTQSELIQKNIFASTDAQLYLRLDSFNRFIFEHTLEYDLLEKPYAEVESQELRSKLHRMCDLGFTFFEEIFKHHVKLKLLETEDWEKWLQNMKHFFRKAYVPVYWKTVSGRYARSFQILIDELINESGKAAETP